jgi:uroporphyrinogen decarboxylase
MERVLTALSHKEPDRVPLFLTLTLHGAKELGLSIKEYFAKAEHVVKGSLYYEKNMIMILSTVSFMLLLK